MLAVIIEEDYKGNYHRYALTLEEFQSEIKQYIDEDIPAPSTDGESITVKPLVHIWYKLVEVGSDDWNVFFTDMKWGFESDIEDDNGDIADVRLEECLSLAESVKSTMNGSGNVE